MVIIPKTDLLKKQKSVAEARIHFAPSNSAQTKFKPKAFSLVELAIVLLIIGIIAGGVMKGSNLVTSARVIGARSLTSKASVSTTQGLVAWYETSLKNSFEAEEIGNNAQVTKWYDVSPGSVALKKNTLTKSASADVTYQRAGINNIPAIKFTGSDSLSLASFYQGSSAQLTVFLVFQPLSNLSSNLNVLLDSHQSGLTNSIGIKSNAVSLNAGSSNDTGNVTNPANFLLGESYIAAIYFNRDVSSIYVNDTANLIGGGNLNPGTNSITGLTIGSDKNSSNGFNGLISEIIIFDRPLKLQERKDVMTYLSKKYHIAISGQ